MTLLLSPQSSQQGREQEQTAFNHPEPSTQPVTHSPPATLLQTAGLSPLSAGLWETCPKFSVAGRGCRLPEAVRKGPYFPLKQEQVLGHHHAPRHLEATVWNASGAPSATACPKTDPGIRTWLCPLLPAALMPRARETPRWSAPPPRLGPAAAQALFSPEPPLQLARPAASPSALSPCCLLLRGAAPAQAECPRVACPPSPPAGD